MIGVAFGHRCGIFDVPGSAACAHVLVKRHVRSPLIFAIAKMLGATLPNH
jgi:hypothetical protein